MEINRADVLVIYMGDFLERLPLFSILIMLLFTDVILSWVVSLKTKKMNQIISRGGMLRKAIKLIMLAIASVLEPFSNGLPVSKLVALIFIYSLAVNVLNHLIALDYPIPEKLKSILQNETFTEWS